MKTRSRPPHSKSGSAHYEVGYGKPPKHTQFKRGQSGNPAGRRTGSKNNVPRNNYERLKALILEEAYRPIRITDASGDIELPMAQAVLRSISVNAAKGNPRAQRLFTDLVGTTEQERQRTLDQLFATAVEYKDWWEEELRRREELGLTGPEPLPHPDQVLIDPWNGTVRIVGPLTKEEKASLDFLREKKEAFEEELQWLQKRLKRKPSDEYLLSEVKRLQRLLRALDQLDWLTAAEDGKAT